MASLKKLRSALSEVRITQHMRGVCSWCAPLQVEPFSKPKIELEQYNTDADLAARIMLVASSKGDIAGHSVADLGTGTGMLAIAAKMAGATHVVGVDTDPDAIKDAQSNLDKLEMDEDVDLVLADVRQLSRMLPRPRPLPSSAAASASAASAATACSGPTLRRFDTVLMNPPFGTRRAGADVEFLEAAMQLRPAAIYSLHKSSTRAHLVSKCRDLGWSCTPVAEIAFSLPKSYAFHKEDEATTAVDLLRLVPMTE
jgi:rRNA N6-adenosine-methyltransferase METTL5